MGSMFWGFTFSWYIFYQVFNGVLQRSAKDFGVDLDDRWCHKTKQKQYKTIWFFCCWKTMDLILKLVFSRKSDDCTKIVFTKAIVVQGCNSAAAWNPGWLYTRGKHWFREWSCHGGGNCHHDDNDSDGGDPDGGDPRRWSWCLIMIMRLIITD